MTDYDHILELHFKPRELAQGEFYVREGQYSKTIAYVESGLLHSYQIDRKGDMVTTNFYQPSSFCGSYYSFYRQAPSLESIKAITDARIHTIGYDKLQELFEKELLINRISRIATEQVCIEKDIRISKLLKLDATQRYLWFMKTYPFIIEKSPLKHIASYLGMTQETLSRIRKDISS